MHVGMWHSTWGWSLEEIQFWSPTTVSTGDTDNYAILLVLLWSWSRPWAHVGASRCTKLSLLFSLSQLSPLIRNPSGLPEIDTSKTELFVSRILPMFSELQIYPMTLLLYGKVCPEYPQVMDTLTLCKVEHNQSTRITISLNIYHVAPWTEGEMVWLVDSHPNQCDSAPMKQ